MQSEPQMKLFSRSVLGFKIRLHFLYLHWCPSKMLHALPSFSVVCGSLCTWGVCWKDKCKQRKQTNPKAVWFHINKYIWLHGKDKFFFKLSYKIILLKCLLSPHFAFMCHHSLHFCASLEKKLCYCWYWQKAEIVFVGRCCLNALKPYEKWIAMKSNLCPNSNKTNKSHRTAWKSGSRVQFDDEHKQCNRVHGTKMFPKPAVFAAVIVFLKHWTIDGNGKSGFEP